jgi:hypothetical protein
MKIKKFLTQDKLLKYLGQETIELLREYKVWSFGAMGFLDADNEDPDYFGIASWHCRPLATIVEAGPYLTITNITPTNDEIELMVAGSDFEGLMNFTQLSIGQMLLYKTYSMNDAFGDNDNFWLNYNSTVITLNMASDRIRDYLLALFSCKGIDYSHYTNGKKKKYTQPFYDLWRLVQAAGLQDKCSKNQVDGSKQLASNIMKRRKSRNEIVHEIATKLGKQENSFMNSLQANGSKSRTDILNEKPVSLKPYEEQKAKFNESKDKAKAEITDAADFCIDWYNMLLELSNNLFWIEYKLR